MWKQFRTFFEIQNAPVVFMCMCVISVQSLWFVSAEWSSFVCFLHSLSISNALRMANRAFTNGNSHQTKLNRCSSNVGDSVVDKSKVGWTSPRDIWRNLSLRRKAEVNIIILTSSLVHWAAMPYPSYKCIVDVIIVFLFSSEGERLSD